MDQAWTISDLVAESKTRLEALPPPKNGQVRAVPDERTVRYYGTIGLLDPPLRYRGRTALYGPRHLAQIVAIKRMQSAEHSLGDIQRMWPTLDDATLTRVTGVELPVKEKARPARRDFWKQDVAAPAPAPMAASAAVPMAASAAVPMAASAAAPAPMAASAAAPMSASAAAPMAASAPAELRIELAAGTYIVVAIPDGATISPADIRALREAAAPLVTELAQRGLT